MSWTSDLHGSRIEANESFAGDRLQFIHAKKRHMVMGFRFDRNESASPYGDDAPQQLIYLGLEEFSWLKNEEETV